jgi:hypothetical protein
MSDSDTKSATASATGGMTADPSTWPAGISQLASQELNALGIDIHRRLYWHGKPIDLGQTFVLTATQKFWGVLLASGALLAFLATVVQGWTAALTWMCHVGWVSGAMWCGPG